MADDTPAPGKLLKEAFLAVANGANSTQEFYQTLSVLAGSGIFDPQSARLLKATADSVGGHAHERVGRPEIDDSVPLRRILDAVACGELRAHAVAVEARKLARHGGSAASHAQRLRGKLREQRCR